MKPMQHKTEKELFYTDEKEVLKLAEWEANGRPYMWVQKYSREGITIWADYGYGNVRIAVRDAEVKNGTVRIDSGVDYAMVDGVIAFGPAYAGLAKEYVPYTLRNACETQLLLAVQKVIEKSKIKTWTYQEKLHKGTIVPTGVMFQLETAFEAYCKDGANG